MKKIMYASEEKIQELIKQKETQSIVSFASISIGFLYSSILDQLIDSIYVKLNKGNKVEHFKHKYENKFHIEIVSPNTITSEMEFPINHPIDGGIYANSDINPNYYCPIAIYHKYMQEMKQQDFLQLCSSLGAKTIKLISEYDIDKDLSSTSKVKFFHKAEIDTNISVSYKHNEKQNIEYNFEKNISTIKEYDSPWFNEEPSWKTMQTMRLKSNLLHQRVTYSYYDDFGINAGFAANMVQLGASLGGEFHNIKRIQREYEIEFWPLNGTSKQ